MTTITKTNAPTGKTTIHSIGKNINCMPEDRSNDKIHGVTITTYEKSGKVATTHIEGNKLYEYKYISSTKTFIKIADYFEGKKKKFMTSFSFMLRDGGFK